MFWIKQRIEQLHSDQSGAIMLLLMAAFLVLFMVTMVLYDTGMAARDKMDAQIAADASAYSHSVVKSRSMNMISYANIIKRMIFSWSVSYVNGVFALIAVTAAHVGACFKIWPRVKSCIELATNAVLIIAELAETYFSSKSLSLIGSSGKAGAELIALERYQQYMQKITPWWAWVENVTRSIDNGAMATTSWPPPPSGVQSLVNAITSAGGAFDWAFGTDVLASLPSVSGSADALPVARRDRIVNWSRQMDPFNFSISKGAFSAGVDYCIEWTGSFEQLVVTVQTAMSEAGGYEWWRGAYLFLQFAGGSIGCAMTQILWSRNPINMAHLDWKLNDTKFSDLQTWVNSTANLTVAYRPRSGRNSDHREKMNIVDQEYGGPGSTFLFKNEGYFATAKSEIVYKPAIGTDASGMLGGLTGVLSGIPLLNNRLGIQPEPDMWSPRWTARLRPVSLPGETWGSASTANFEAGFNTVVNDTIPYLLFASLIGLIDDDFSLGSAALDAFYLLRSGQSMDSDKIGGFSK